MARPSLRDGVDMLWALQLRRENKALLGRIDNAEKQVVRDAAECRRLLQVEQERITVLAQELEEIKGDGVIQKELQACKERESARDARDTFFATGAMGEHERMMAERSIAARAERPHCESNSSAIFDQFHEMETQIIAPLKPYKSPFFPRKSTHDNDKRAEGNFNVNPLSAAELETMKDVASSRFSEDHFDHDDDGDLDALIRGIEDGTAIKAPQDTTLNTSSKRGEKPIIRVMSRAGVGYDKRGEAAPAKLVNDQPTMVVVMKANPQEKIQISHISSNKKRPHEAISNVGLRVAEHIAEQDRKKAKRPQVTTPKPNYGHRPETRSTLIEEIIEPPPRPYKLASKPKPKPVSTSVASSVVKSLSKPDPQPVSKLPRLVQGRTPLAKYYKESNEAYSAFENKTQQGQHEFVNHFLAGIHAKKDKDSVIAELQQTQDSTFKNGKPWIMCHWADVLGALVFAKLVKRRVVA